MLYPENDWVYVVSEEEKEGFIPHSYCAQFGSQLATLALNVKKKMPREAGPGDPGGGRHGDPGGGRHGDLPPPQPPQPGPVQQQGKGELTQLTLRPTSSECSGAAGG